ncbi:MAG: peptidase M41, partial [Alistipes sp.]|nr:peptidase M41 [Alistipes sp.]
MAQNSKQNNRRPAGFPRPSIWWVYGTIGALIFGWYLFSEADDTPLPSDWSAVGRMVRQGEVERIRVVNRDRAEVFLTDEAAERYRTDSVPRYRRLPGEGPHLVFTIPSVDSFREDLGTAGADLGRDVPVVYETKTSDWTNMLVNLLPWVLIIGVWFFLMRSMSRGAGGGAGGGIMNVGKA